MGVSFNGASSADHRRLADLNTRPVVIVCESNDRKCIWVGYYSATTQTPGKMFAPLSVHYTPLPSLPSRMTDETGRQEVDMAEAMGRTK